MSILLSNIASFIMTSAPLDLKYKHTNIHMPINIQYIHFLLYCFYSFLFTIVLLSSVILNHTIHLANKGNQCFFLFQRGLYVFWVQRKKLYCIKYLPMIAEFNRQAPIFTYLLKTFI